jgi:predicted extracellular nuclease
MSYNLQNLFDTKDNPDTNDEEFTPTGKQHWTERVLADKIQNLGEVIRMANADVVGVVEVENQEVLNQLLRDGLRGQGYVSAYAGPSDDDRGIRCGVISKYPIINVKSHRVWDDSWQENGGVKKTRDILEVTVRITKGNFWQEVTYLVNHWPSRAGNPSFRNRIRLETAQKMKAIVQDLVNQDPTKLVISMGDFNDELQDESFRSGVNVLTSLSDFMRAEAGSLFATDSDIPEGQGGTFYYAHDHQWNELDHILVAAGSDVVSQRSPSFKYVPGSTKIVRSRFVSNGQFPQGCEVYKGSRETCPNGASDHFPLIADFAL